MSPVTSLTLADGTRRGVSTNFGDTVDYHLDEDWIGKATRWNTPELQVVKELGFPGETGEAHATTAHLSTTRITRLFWCLLVLRLGKSNSIPVCDGGPLRGGSVHDNPNGQTYRQLQSLSDSELMAELRAGHHDSIAVILERYQRLVWSIAQRILHDEGEAEDTVQVVFMELFQKVELFDPARGTLKVWLSQLAYARSINRRYHLQRRKFYSQVDVDEQYLFSAALSSALHLNSSETSRLIREVLGSLGPKQRTAVELIAVEGLTFDELAARMEESLSNAKHHYYRGMMKLRECLMSASPKPTNPEEREKILWEIKNARARSV